MDQSTARNLKAARVTAWSLPVAVVTAFVCPPAALAGPAVAAGIVGARGHSRRKAARAQAADDAAYMAAAEARWAQLDPKSPRGY